MFFYIGDSCDLLNKVDNNLFLDKGWQFAQKHDKKIHFKGYTLEGLLDKQLDDILEGKQPDGNWAVIVKDHEYRIHHSKFRGFPVYAKDNVKTNLNLPGLDYVINAGELGIDYSIELSVDIVSIKAKTILANNCLSLYRTYKQPLEIHVSGGMDTTSVIAVCEACEIPYTLHMKPFKEYFKTLQEASGTVTEYTSPLVEFCRKTYEFCRYASIYNEKKLVTGYMGDGIFARSPWQLALIANSLNLTLGEVVKETDYVYSYIRRGANNYLFNRLQTIGNVKKELETNHANSDLMWHIDNTYYLSPFMSSKIYEAVLSMSVEDLYNTENYHDTIKHQINF